MPFVNSQAWQLCHHRCSLATNLIKYDEGKYDYIETFRPRELITFFISMQLNCIELDGAKSIDVTKSKFYSIDEEFVIFII